jgi:hypothetical protein
VSIEAAGMHRFRHCWKPADTWQLSSGHSRLQVLQK